MDEREERWMVMYKERIIKMVRELDDMPFIVQIYTIINKHKQKRGH